MTVRHRIRQLANKARVLAQFQRSTLFRYGWLRAWWVNRPVDAKGDAIPWITYPALDFISQFDFSDASVFEWGSGFSTLWWAKRCRHITAVESNQDWVSYIRPMLPKDVELVVTSFDVDAEVLALTLAPAAMHDVIVIDNNGPFRWRCAQAAVGHLAPGGMILLDNSDQCLRACAVLRDAGLTQIDFTGFAPAAGYAQTTSIFFRGRFKFQTIARHQPLQSAAQPNPPWENC